MLKKISKIIGKSLIGLITLSIILLIIGYVGENFAKGRAKENYPPPGKLVDIEGQKLHYLEVGEGEPTVIFESGSGMPSFTWEAVQLEVSMKAKTIVYDRAGYGWSEGSTTPRTGEQIATELKSLLDKEKIDGPYILVGHSLGGSYVRLFADMYPDDVAGIVLVDPRPEQYATVQPLLTEKQEKAASQNQVAGFLTNFGVVRLMGDQLLPSNFPKSMKEKMTSIGLESKFFKAVQEEGEYAQELDIQLKEIESLGSVPLTIITRGIPEDYSAIGLTVQEAEEAENTWHKLQEEMLDLSTNSRLVKAENSGHFIMVEEPDMISDEIIKMMNQLNNRR